MAKISTHINGKSRILITACTKIENKAKTADVIKKKTKINLLKKVKIHKTTEYENLIKNHLKI